MLTLYKAVTAVKAAKDFSQKLNRKIVPIFWLQSEDHDLEEISSVTVHGTDGMPKAISALPSGGKENRKSVSGIKFDSGIERVISELEGELRSGAFSPELFSILKEAYVSGSTWSKAFLELFKRLFLNSELLFFDIQHPRARNTQAVRRLIATSFSRYKTIEQLLVEQTSAAGIKGGVQIKSGSPLSFYTGSSGDRARLVVSETQEVKIGSELLSVNDVARVVEAEPGNFTSSALLRPLLQDTLFPTFAYVGGDAEQVYHLQLDKVYGELKIPPPLLIPRAKFRLLGRKSAQILSELGIELDEFQKPDDEVARALRTNGKEFGLDTDAILMSVSGEMERIVTSLAQKVSAIDQTLLDPLEKTKQNALKPFEQFLSKLKKAALLKDSVILGRINRVRTIAFPFYKEQERELGSISVLARTGLRLIEMLEEQIVNYDGKVQVLMIEELG